MSVSLAEVRSPLPALSIVFNPNAIGQEGLKAINGFERLDIV